MFISRLDIKDLRVVSEISIEPGRRLNFITGSNGAGKTSILEAIYLAGRGRTFRHADSGPLIRLGAECTTVVVKFSAGGPGTQKVSTLGIRREKRDFFCRLDGEDVKRRSVLAEALPVQWIGSQPQLLLDLGPEVRRRVIDMGLFHVEHPYLQLMSQFQKVLKQRNAAIRQGKADSLSAWNSPFVESALSVDRLRKQFVSELAERTSNLVGSWNQDIDVSISYNQGWERDLPLSEALQKKTDVDLRLGYTRRGPQRAELEIRAGNALASKTLSRGQQKMLILAVNLALHDLIVERRGVTPILLIDDLAAELDRDNRARVISEIEKRGGQAFLTRIEETSLRSQTDGTTMFHVEQGALK